MGIEVFTGTISGLAKPTRAVSLHFTLDQLPVQFYVPGCAVVGVPIRRGDFVAVAAKRTLVPGVEYVALAFRCFGLHGSGHTIGAGWPAACVAIGALGGYLAYYAYRDGLGTPFRISIEASMLLGGAWGAFRLIDILRAVRVLDRVEMPLTTRSSGRR